MQKQTANVSSTPTAARQVYELTCQNTVCGKKFETVIFWRRFCSNACRQASYKRRKQPAQDSQGTP
jgi:hypothetical protein